MSEEISAAIGLRGPTGAKAETAFVTFHQQTGLPVRGVLRDCRHDQCGYDFAIDAESERTAIEVKGLAGQQGGISLTDKEWQVAQEMGDRYFLAIVRDVSSDPQVSLVQNPAAVFKPEMRLFTTIQVSWSVNQPALRSAEAGKAS